MKLKTQNNMSFIENKGQWLDGIQFKSELAFGNIYFEKDNFTFILIENEEHHHHAAEDEHENHEKKGHHFKIRFENANEEVTFSQENKSGNYYNYFLGNNSKYWASHVHSYKAITYHNLYNGIDMKVEGIADNMKYEYYVAPFANPSAIQVKYEGIDDLSIKDGNLVYHTAVAGITELKPVVYQMIGGEKVYINCEYQLNKKNNTVRFNLLEKYNKSIELVIDPTLIFSSYTASTLNNFGFTATYDEAGNLYGGGIIYGATAGLMGYPSINSFNLNDTTHGGVQNGGFLSEYMNHGYASDIAISKFSTDGTTLLYSTLIGGFDNEQPQSLVTDTAGNLYVYGRTFSSDFPATINAYDNTHNDSADIVIFKISPDGGTLLASTFVGGSNADGVNMQAQLYVYGQLRFNYADDGRGEIILDEEGNVYVASTTQSTDIFPGFTSFQNTIGGGLQDACVFKLNTDLSAMIWGSFLGGSNNDAGYSLKLDGLGHVFVAGGTNSADFPNTVGGLNPTYNGGQADGFLAKIDTNGAVLQQSTYIGTASYDQSYFIEIDEFNDVFTYGQTTGSYPVSAGVYSNPNSSQFIHKLNNDLNTTVFSTVFGSGDSTNVNISPTAFLVDYCGNIYISGWGGTTNQNQYNGNATGTTIGMPVTPNAFQTTTDGSDFYFMVLAKDAESLLYATYFGGNQNITGGSGEHVDGGTSRFDKNGVIYQAVCASCGSPTSNFPTTAGAWSQIDSAGAGCNLGVIKMDVYIPPTIVDIDASPTATGCVPLTVNFEADLVNVNLITWDFGDGTTTNIEDPTHIFSDTGTYVIRLIGEDTTLCNLADTAYLSVIVGDDSLVANFINDLNIDCRTSSVSIGLENYPTTEYLWTMGDGTIYTTDSVYHEYQNPGDYLIKLLITDSTSCELMDSSEAMITILPALQANLQISDTFACIPLVLNYSTTTDGQSYLWNFGNGDFSSSQNGNYTYVNTGIFNISLIVEDTFSCNVLDTVFAQVISDDNRVEALADFTILNSCDSLLSIQIDNQSINGDEYQWQFDGTDIQTVEEPGIYNFTRVGSHTIQLTVRNDSLCNPIDTLIRNFTLLPNANANFTLEDNCVDSEIQIENNSSANTTFNWIFGNGIPSIEQNPTVEYSVSGLYTVSLTVIDSNSCNITNTFSQEVNIIDYAVANFETDSINYLYPDDVYFTNLSHNYNTFNWEFGDGNTDNENENPIHSYEILYDIKPCLTVANEFCEDVICKDIYIDFEMLIGVPNAFSPNNDGNNDIIYVEGVGIDQLNFKIYNRWGILVFESNDQQVGWDGTYNGINQEMEVYTYVVDALFINEKSVVLKGNITLLR